jgi:hypothetical protein
VARFSGVRGGGFFKSSIPPFLMTDFNLSILRASGVVSGRNIRKSVCGAGALVAQALV